MHGANGYLIEQFLNPIVNLRTDGHGGSIEGRNRPALEIARATVAAVGSERVGIRLSPYGVFNGTGEFPEVRSQNLALFDHASAEKALLEKRGDLIAFGRPFLANPDLVARLRQDAPLNAPDMETFYVPGAKGYTDYPALGA